jgi:hypothetical protein
MRHAFCTIVARNYLQQAVVLIETLRNFHADEDFFLLVVDSEVQLSDDIKNLNILSPELLDVSSQDLQIMRKIYDVVEISTCLKPSLLQYIISLGFDSATFLDPDIQVFAPLTHGIEVAIAKQIALTPHRITSSTEFDHIFLEYGIFNLGYICVSKNATDFLLWWRNNLITSCTRVSDTHFFTDQKWINFVPALFPCGIITHPGYNVAPWNLDEREFQLKGNRILVNSLDLAFIHYSQMSGQLAGGGLNNEWSKKLARINMTAENLIIFKDQLKSYVALLENARKSELCLASFIPISGAYSKKNKYFRLKLMHKFRSGTLTQVSSIPSNELARDRLMMWLSKSTIFHALVIAFPMDRKKIQRKMQEYNRVGEKGH